MVWTFKTWITATPARAGAFPAFQFTVMVTLMIATLTRLLAHLPEKWHVRLGLLTSHAIYYGKPFVVRRLMRLYRPFVPAGGLAFDVGAHLGNRTAAFARLGAAVVAVEPNPVCQAELRARFSDSAHIELVDAAVGASAGETQLHVSHLTPSVSTTSNRWLKQVRASRGFDWVRWNEQLTVPTVSLDQLIAAHGRPDFCKLDVEGAELQALNGLSQALAAISFEHTAAHPQATSDCLESLSQLGAYEFNWSPGERARLTLTNWLEPEQARRMLSHPELAAGSADIFARRADLVWPESQ